MMTGEFLLHLIVILPDLEERQRRLKEFLELYHCVPKEELSTDATKAGAQGTEKLCSL